MKKNEFYILNSLYNGSIGRADCSYALDCVRALSDTRAYNRLVHAGYIDKESGTPSYKAIPVRIYDKKTQVA